MGAPCLAMYAYAPLSVGVATLGEHVMNERTMQSTGHGMSSASGAITQWRNSSPAESLSGWSSATTPLTAALAPRAPSPFAAEPGRAGLGERPRRRTSLGPCISN